MLKLVAFSIVALQLLSIIRLVHVAKEIWDHLEVTYEGTSEVKEARISLLKHKHHKFKMLLGESIDSIFSCFADIANPLKSLGAEISMKRQISKILYALKGTNWVQMRAAIQESYNYPRLTFEGMMGKLKAFEEQEKQLDSKDAPQVSNPKVDVKKEKQEKSLAFKALKGEATSSSEDEGDDVIALLTRNFNKFLKEIRSSLRKRKMIPFIGVSDVTPRSF